MFRGVKAHAAVRPALECELTKLHLGNFVEVPDFSGGSPELSALVPRELSNGVPRPIAF